MAASQYFMVCKDDHLMLQKIINRVYLTLASIVRLSYVP